MQPGLYPNTYSASTYHHTTQNVNLIVLGAGLIGPRHCTHIVNRYDCKLMAVIDHSKNGPSVASKFSTKLFEDLDSFFDYVELNNLEYPHGAIVATPNHTHVELGMKLAAKGIHLLVEKPLHSDPAECRKLISYCYKQGVKLLIGHHRRFNPFILKTKESLSHIGRPIAVQGSWCLRKNYDYFLEKNWRVNRDLGGGTLLINLVHDLDLLLYLLGPISKIYAELLPNQRGFEVDEGAVLSISFKNGCKGTFICGDNIISPFNFESGTGENPNVPYFENLAGFYRIFGSKGTLSVPDLTLYHQNSLKNGMDLDESDSKLGSWSEPVETTDLSLLSYQFDGHNDLGLKTPSPSPNASEFMKPPPKPFDLQLNHFINLINGRETESNCTGEDALNALLCIETVLKSVESGLPEFVPELDSL